jgi:hypothetical protein
MEGLGSFRTVNHLRDKNTRKRQLFRFVFVAVCLQTGRGQHRTDYFGLDVLGEES